MPTFALETLPRDQYIFALLVGDSGAGKTTAAASFPKPIVVIDVDRRIKGINGSPWVNRTDIDVVWLPGDNLMFELEILFTEWELLQDKGKFKYKTIIFDGFTSTSMLLIDNSFVLTGKDNTMTKDGNRGPQGHPKIGTINIAGWDEYSYELGGFKGIMTTLKYSFKCNILCTAHWMEVYGKDKNTKETVVVGKRINLRPRIIPSVSIWFDEVWYLEKSMKTKAVQKIGAVDYQEHKVIFRNDIARTTFPTLPQSLDITEKQFYPLLLEALKAELEVTDGKK